ncbi:MAG TPA: hypothetical protein DEP85_08135, partial [Holosporales bacterium]|nr:hypothetical protein [Holosporales bacterium]
AQEHLGPVRMRHHMNEALLRSQMLQKANEKLAQDPKSVIETITQNRAVFTGKDIDIFLNKHVPFNEREGLFEKVIESKDVLSLYDKETGKKTGYFTTQEVRSEEEKLIRFADNIANKPRVGLNHPLIVGKQDRGIILSPEQKAAYEHCVNENRNLCLIQGRAGVGKSTVLTPIRMAHEESGFRVLGLAPTHKVALDLKADGFKEAKTCHAFLFAFKNNRETLNSNTLVVVDEAGMMGTELSVELFHVIKTSGAKLLLVGDDRQLSSVARGGAFGLLAERYGAVTLQEVRRQTIDWQKAVSEDLSKGDVRNAVSLLEENKAIQWKDTKEDALSDILKDWAKESHSHGTRIILAQKNIDVDALNQGARDILCEQGRLGSLEVTCMTQRGKMSFAEGDRIHFTKTDRDQGLLNGYFGTIEKIDPQTKKLTVLLDNKEKKEVDPHTYDGLRHGYASTVYKAQGSTLDHVYVLHSKIIDQSVNYVALTRQTKSLSLYVSKDETPTEAHLIRQMTRQDGNGPSLRFDTLKDIEKRHEEKTLATHIKQGAEKVVTKIKDVFHKNEDFYNFEKPKDLSNHPVSLSPSPNKKTPEPISEDLKRAMLGDELYNRIYNPKPKATQSQAVTEDLKRTMLGEELYNRVHNPTSKTSKSQAISEDLKKAMVGEEFYNKAHGKDIYSTSSTLKAVYEDMRQPAFASHHPQAKAIRKAFEKGLKLYGEERAIAYWESKKEELVHLYQESLTKVEKELNSPHLIYLSEKWKNEAREFAKQDPAKTLKLIQNLKDNALERQEPDLREKPEERTIKQKNTDHQNTLEATYLRFKALRCILKDNPKAESYFEEEFKRLGKELAQDKDFMKSLKLQDTKEAKFIERMMKEEHSRSLTLDRGGLSL